MNAESADLREVYKRLAERHSEQDDELRERSRLCPCGGTNCDCDCLRNIGAGVEGR